MSDVLCKWVSDDLTTVDGIYWEENLKLNTPKFHCYYKHPLIAIIFKERHGFDCCKKLYEVKPGGMIFDGNYICRSTELTLIKELETTEVTLIQQIAFAILCVLEVYKDSRFVNWAENWLSGKDRSKESVLSVNNFLTVLAPGSVDSEPSASRAVDAAVAAVDAAIAFAANSYVASVAHYSVYCATAYVANAVCYAVSAHVIENKIDFDLLPVAQKAMEVQ